MYTECQFLNRIDRIYYFILYIPFKSTSPLKIVFHSTLSLNHSVFLSPSLVPFLSLSISYSFYNRYYLLCPILHLLITYPLSSQSFKNSITSCFMSSTIVYLTSFSADSPSNHLTNIDYFFFTFITNKTYPIVFIFGKFCY